jgi:hypothetical protein
MKTTLGKLRHDEVKTINFCLKMADINIELSSSCIVEVLPHSTNEYFKKYIVTVTNQVTLICEL